MKLIALILVVFLCSLHAGAQIIVPIAGNGGTTFTDGPATAAMLDVPLHIAFDDSDNLLICDMNNVRLRKVQPSYNGYMTTIAGTGSSGYWGDGGLATTAGFKGIIDVAVDRTGNIYIADADDNRIRKIDKSGIITTFAGTGIAGFNGDGIAATSAMLNSPHAVKVDDKGNVYIGDRYNFRLRKVDTFGVITTIAGTGVAGFSGDGGPAIVAKTNGLMAIALDTAGNIFFSDTVRIRKIAVDGTITTVAGNGIVAFTGDGGPATAASIRPAAIFVDKTGVIYIADGLNHRIRKVGVDGTINTIAGTGMAGISGDWGPPLLATLCAPNGIAVSKDGDIYFSNACSARVKMITNKDLGVTGVGTAAPSAIDVAPNPNNGVFTLKLQSAKEESANITMIGVTGEIVYQTTGSTNSSMSINIQAPAGVYTMKVQTKSDVLCREVIMVR